MSASAPYRSAEIALDQMAPEGSFTLWGTPACAVFDDELWIVGSWFSAEGPSTYGRLYQTTLALVDPSHAGATIDIENGAVATPSLWSTQPIVVDGDEPVIQVDIGWRDPSWTMQDNVAPSSFGLAAVGDELVLCWIPSRAPDITSDNPPTHEVRVAVYSRADGVGGWRLSVRLLDHDGNSLVAADSTCGVRAVAFGTDCVIVSCSATSSGPGAGAFYVGWFQTADIDQKAMSWKAGNGSYVESNAAAVWLDWYSGTVASTEAPDVPVERPPSFVLWVSVLPAGSPDANVETTLVAFDADGRTSSPLTSAFAPADMGGTLLRDPAGRICRYQGRQGKIGLRTFHTATSPDGTQPIPSHDLTLDAPSSQDPSVNMSAGHPGVAYFMDRSRPVTLTLDGRPGTGYPIYEFLFYGPCQVRRYGTAEVYPAYGKEIGLRPATPDTVLIAGIVDGPIPIPNVNISSVSFADTEPEFATVQYGMTITKEQEHSVKNSWTVGFKTEGESSKGIGPAWDISLSGGMASTQTDRSSDSVSDMTSAPTVLDDATRNELGRQAVLPVGHVFAATATFSWTAFRFLDADGTVVCDGTQGGESQAPLFTTISCRFDTGDTFTYLPYAVSPGDLTSYTPESWTERMKEVGWAGGDYLAEVIEPNAATLGDKKFLRFSLDNGGGTVTENDEQITSHVIESGWSVDSETYVGISGGEGVSIFGLGEDMSFKFLVGGTYSHETTDSAGNEHGVTVGLTDDGIKLPQAAEAPTVVKNYTFRLYYLPPPGPTSSLPPNYWVKELKDFLPHAPQSEDQLDPGRIDGAAHAWKIVFVVDHYELYDGSVYDWPAAGKS